MGVGSEFAVFASEGSPWFERERERWNNKGETDIYIYTHRHREGERERERERDRDLRLRLITTAREIRGSAHIEMHGAIDRLVLSFGVGPSGSGA